jgi:hypothetical protein
MRKAVSEADEYAASDGGPFWVNRTCEPKARCRLMAHLRHARDVCGSVANGGKPDMTRTVQSVANGPGADLSRHPVRWPTGVVCDQMNRLTIVPIGDRMRRRDFFAYYYGYWVYDDLTDYYYWFPADYMIVDSSWVEYVA